MSTAAMPLVRGEALAQEFEGIFREHCRLVYRTAYSLTGSRQDAEDVLQTIFLRLLQREFPPDIRKNPKAYLYRAAVNLSLNTVRSRKRQRLTDGVERLEAPARADDSSTGDAMKRCLLDAIAQLKPSAVELLILRYEHNYSDAAIAKMLGRSRGAVAVTLYRTRARLKKLMRVASETNYETR